MSYLGVLGNNFEKLFPYLKWAPSNFALIVKFCARIKMPSLAKTIVIFEISTLEFVKSESLTNTVNFSIGSDFSKGPRSAFSEDPSPGLLC